MILVFGQSGQVARELQSILPQARFLSRTDADLSDPEACARLVTELQPSAVINAAAYTAVDTAEAEEQLADTVNGDSPGAIAIACKDAGCPIVHISTDYVFDGSGAAPFSVDMQTAPLGAYGRSKLAGEKTVRDSGAVHAILRTSWVFSAHGNNFVKTMLRLSETRDALNVVDDQVGGPTYAADIAKACKIMAERLQQDTGLSGTYHFSGAPDVSWADFARAIFDAAGRDVAVTGIPSSEYPTPARRPGNSRLDNSGLDKFDITRPDWRPALTAVIKELEKQI